MSNVHRPAADADPYLHYLAGLVHGLELRTDGIEAVLGELRMRIDQIERVIRIHGAVLFPEGTCYLERERRLKSRSS
jgi:hypothetical protein